MKITVAIQSYNFQHRLCWMLSSILQQVPRNPKVSLPEIEVAIAYVKQNGTPLTEDVIEFFKEQGLNIIGHEYPDIKEFQYRGLTRNRALKYTDADWILFADTDMVYHPKYFGELGKLLRSEYKRNKHCLYSRRKSTILKDTEPLIKSRQYPCVIDKAYEIMDKVPAKIKANVGAGYCHIANVMNLRNEHGGIYVNPKRPRDWSWEKRYQKAKSDMHFRKMLGGEPLPDLPLQIHVQHIRDNEEGKHLTIQR